MTGRDLGAKVSSLFDVAAQHRPLKNAGSSVISFACDPRHDEEAGLHKVKKVNPQYNRIYICDVYFKTNARVFDICMQGFDKCMVCNTRNP